MSGRSLFHLLAYDIADPVRLRAVARIAEAHGVRIQYSLFLVRLTPARKRQLLAELARVIHPRQDDVRLYPLPARPEWETMGRAIWPEGVWLAGDWPESAEDEEDLGVREAAAEWEEEWAEELPGEGDGHEE